MTPEKLQVLLVKSDNFKRNESFCHLMYKPFNDFLNVLLTNH